MAITPWIHYADLPVAPICRSRPGSNVPVGDNGIRVNAVCPGTIDTPMLREGAALCKGAGTIDGVIREWGLAHPIGRVGKPEEVGAVIAFLCSPAAAFCTGSEYRVDGGLLAKIGVVDEISKDDPG